MLVIYCYTNIKNGMQYVGQTNDLKKRDNQHRNNHNGTYFDRIYSKHPEDFKLDIIRAFHDISKSALNEQEIYFIARLNTKYPNGYNLTDGGDGVNGYILNDEAREKISNSLKQWWDEHPEAKEEMSKRQTGKKASEETKAKMSQQRKGENHPFFGKHLTDEHKKKISESNTGKKQSEETIEKRRQSLIGREVSEEARKKIGKANGKPVRLKNLNMTFESASEAARWLRSNGWPKATQSRISACCRGERKTAYGYEWEYIDLSEEG